MKNKKLVALGLAMIMAVSTLAACGNTANEESTAGSSSTVVETSETQTSASSETEEATGITFPLEETLTFTAFSMMNGNYKLSETLFMKRYAEESNIVIEYTDVPSSEAATKGSLLMGTGDYPDLLIKSNLNCDKYGMEGLLIPLEDLIKEHCPNLCKILDEWDLWDRMYAADGHIYSFPRINAEDNVARSTYPWINKKWLDNLGLKVPTNPDELYDVLKAFKEQDANGNGDPNDEIPVTAYSNMDTYISNLCDFGLIDRNLLMAVVDDEYVFYPVMEEYRDQYLAFWAKCGAEGLIDDQALIQNKDQMIATGTVSDVYGLFPHSASYFVVGDERYVDYVGLPYVEGLIPAERNFSKNGLAITDKCENPEVICAWIDYLYSPEGSIEAFFGYEGETYAIEENGSYYLLDPEKLPRDAVGIFGSCPSPQLVPIEKSYPSAKDPKALYVKEMGDIRKEGGIQYIPYIALTQDENTKIADLKSDIKSYIESYAAEIMSGRKSLDDTWDEYVKTLEKMGFKEYEEIYQAAYERSKE